MSRELDALALSALGSADSDGSPAGSSTKLAPHAGAAPPPPPEPATADAADPNAATARAAALLRDLQAASGAYTTELSQHHESLKSLAVQLPKLLTDFERTEGQRIDSFKMALKKLLSAEESMLTSQRPLVYAATDMVDAIDRHEDLDEFKAGLHCISSAESAAELLDEQARLLLAAQQHERQLLEGAPLCRAALALHASAATPAATSSSAATAAASAAASAASSAARLAAASLVGRGGQFAVGQAFGSGSSPILSQMNRAAKVTSDFLELTSGAAFANGLVLSLASDDGSGGGGVVTVSTAMELELNRAYTTPSGNHLVRISETQLVLEREMYISIAEAAPPPAAEAAQAEAAQAMEGAAAPPLPPLTASSAAVATSVEERLRRACAFTRCAPIEDGLAVALRVRLRHHNDAGQWKAGGDGGGDSGGGGGSEGAEAGAGAVLELYAGEPVSSASDAGGERRGDGGDGSGGGDGGGGGEGGGGEGADGVLTCEVNCSAETFVAMAEGVLPPSAAVLSQLASTPNLLALIQAGEALAWERDRYVLYAAEQLYARKLPAHARAAADAAAASGTTSPARLAPGTCPSPGGSATGSSDADQDEGAGGGGEGQRAYYGKLGIDEELVRLAKQQMRRLAEEPPDGSQAQAGLLGSLISSYIGGEGTRTAAIINGVRALRAGNLRALRTGGWAARPGGGGAAGAPGAGTPVRELQPGPALLAYLSGDADLAQAFAFMPHAFLGCDWNGCIFVSVQHERGTHLVTLGVSPEAARLYEGHALIHEATAPMLTVVSRREVLLDVIAGRMEATRAVIMGRVQVSDLSKLVVVKSAFRLKKAVFEAYKNAQQVQEEMAQPRGAPDLRTRLQRSPPSAELLAEIAQLGEDAELRRALIFATCAAWHGSDWSGDVVFQLGGPGSTAITVGLSPAGVKLHIRAGKAGGRAGGSGKSGGEACHVLCSRQVLIDVFSGQFEITAAIMSGQMQSDQFKSMMAFKRAFRFDRTAFSEFCEWEARVAAPSSPAASAPPAAAAAATSTAPAVADAECTSAVPTVLTVPTMPTIDDPGLELLRDDHDLYVAVAYLWHAFTDSSMTVCLNCHLAHDGETRHMGIAVTPDGPKVYAGEELLAEMTPTCEVMCDRDVLMRIIRGEMEATNAMMEGLVMVDDLGQLMAFKMAFKLEREAFDVYLAAQSLQQ